MYSSAFNNSSTLMGIPDSQTGTYSFKFDLEDINSYYGFGPDFSLNINFSHLATLDNKDSSRLGLGWSFGISSYDTLNKLLTLSNGTSYQVVNENYYGENWELAHKTKDVSVFYSDNAYGPICILYKDGSKEILKKDYALNYYVLDQIISNRGKIIYFEYSGGLLNRIYSSESDLVIMNYDYNYTEVEITLYPSTLEEKKYSLDIISQRLQKINFPDFNTISFVYKNRPYPEAPLFIEEVTYPTGAKESIEYNNNLYLPSGSPFLSRPMPALSKYTKKLSSNDPDIIMIVDYGDIEENNFWGNNAYDVIWGKYEDQLYNHKGKYEYSNRVTIGDKAIENTYNKFHQLIVSIETNGNESYKKTTYFTYYSLDDQILENQPVNYEFPKSKTITFKSPEGEKSITESYVYDEWGNNTQMIEANGVTTNISLYSEIGEEGCPAHPFGMRAFVKKEEVIAVNNNGIPKVTEYTYKDVSTLDSNWVVVKTKKYGLYTLMYTYFDDTNNSNIIAQVKLLTLSYDNKVESTEYTYIFNPDRITQTTKFTGFDYITTTESEIHSRWELLLESETDIEGITTAYTYDVLGRKLTETNAVGSDYEVIATFGYTYLASSSIVLPDGENNTIGIQIIEKTQDIISHVYQDAEGKDLTTYTSDKEDVLYKVSETSYDNLSRELIAEVWDYKLNKYNIESSDTYSNFVTYQYGYWGEVNQTTYEDGTIVKLEINPIQQSKTEYVEDKNGNILPKTVTIYDLFQNIKSEKLLTSDEEQETIYSLKEYTYDGFGNLKQNISPLGNVFSIDSYDLFDRPTGFTHFDGGTYQVDYFERSNNNMPEEIKILNFPGEEAPISLGSLLYDSLSRVTSKTNHGITKTFEFDVNNYNSIPNTLINGRKQFSKFEYIKEIGRLSSIKTYSDSSLNSLLSSASFIFSNKDNTSIPVGSLTTTTNDISQYDYSFQKTGSLDTVNQKIKSGKINTSIRMDNLITTNNRAQKHHDYGEISQASDTVVEDRVDDFPDKLSSLEEYSLSGISLKIKVGDRIINKVLDVYGRIETTTDGSLQAKSVYDNFGRVHQVDLYRTTNLDSSVQSIIIEYDDYSRERKRTITILDSNTTIDIQTEYDIEDRISKRNIIINSSESLVEHYQYDCKNRLIKYYVDDGYSPSLLASDYNNKGLLYQEFTYDLLDNLITLDSHYSDNSSEIKKFDYIVQRLDHISVSGNDITEEMDFSYDADGNLISISGDQNTNIGYNVFNQVSNFNGTDYKYDSSNQLVQIGDFVGRYYIGNKVISEVSDGDETCFVGHDSFAIGEETDRDAKILVTDSRSSVIGVTQNEITDYNSYTPLGIGKNNSRKKFNGELLDRTSGGYMLGNGTRLYLADIGIFTSLDTSSPFKGGGLNPYRYCNGNSINLQDPSGHFAAAILGFISIANTIVSAILGAKGHEKAAKITGGIALVSGIVSGIASTTRKGARNIGRGKNGVMKASKKKWHYSSAPTNDGKTRMYYGSNYVIKGSDLKKPIGNIMRRRDSNSSIRIYSGGHGSRTVNWNFAPKKVSATRRIDLSESRFYRSDKLIAPTGKINGRNVHVIDISSSGELPVAFRKPIPFNENSNNILPTSNTPNMLERTDPDNYVSADYLESLSKPGHHINAFCFGMNDEIMRGFLGIGSVPVYS